MIITSNMDIVADDGEFEGVTNRYAAIGPVSYTHLDVYKRQI